MEGIVQRSKSPLRNQGMNSYSKLKDRPNITVTAKEFLTDLVDNSEVLQLENCTIEGQVTLTNTGISFYENEKSLIGKKLICRGCVFVDDVDFSHTRFCGYMDFSETVFRGRVDFTNTQIEGNASFAGVSFKRNVDFTGTQFGGDADFTLAEFSTDDTFTKAIVEGNANFIEARFSGYADFREISFKGNTSFKGSQFSKVANFTSAQFDRPADFSYVQYTRDNPFRIRGRQPTQFYLDSQNISEVLSPRFKRYVGLLQSIRELKNERPILAWLWHLWAWLLH
jgi:uncharacterized protein YjbI with pentapeptide repeats